MIHLIHLPDDIVIGNLARFFDIDDLSHFTLACNQFLTTLQPHFIRLYGFLADTHLYSLGTTLPNWAFNAHATIYSMLRFSWGLRKGTLQVSSPEAYTYYGPTPESVPPVSYLSIPKASVAHNDKIVGLTSVHIEDDNCNQNLFAAGSFDASITISSTHDPTKVQLAFQTSGSVSIRPIITCLGCFEQNGIMIVVAGDKNGNLMAWTTTLFGVEGMAGFAHNHSVVNEIRRSINLSSVHIRSLRHLCSSSLSGGGGGGADLIVVGDGDGRTIIVNVLFSKATEAVAPDIHFAIVQSSWVHDSAVVSIKKSKSGGFVSIEKEGSIGVWNFDCSQQQKGEATPRVHYRLKGIDDVTGRAGRAVTCMELIEPRTVTRKKTTSTTTAVTSFEESKSNVPEPKKCEGNQWRETTTTNINAEPPSSTPSFNTVAFIGTRGVYGTKNKAIRHMLKDHTIIGYSVNKKQILFQIPNSHTIYSILPISFRYILVASEVDEDECECLSLWDIETNEVIQTFKIGTTEQQYGRIHHLLAMTSSKTKLISHLVIGTSHGITLTLGVGFG